ncbi:hypothetical protein MMC14_005302 [Varicellaria rhodocarpa]|nr:hypothetical protein [Varicellaria rhodocarpa]
MDEAEKILKGKYPAKAHAVKVVDYLKKKSNVHGVIYLEGQKTHMFEDSDEAMPFRQRRNFYYLSGCDLPDSYLAYNIETTHLTLFIPPIDPDDVIWSGLPLSPAEARKIYNVDDVRLTSEVNAFIESQSFPKDCIWTIQDQVSSSTNLSTFTHRNSSLLKSAIEECRVVKDAYEIALIRKANSISTIAHTAVLRAAKHAKNERELAAIFLERCLANGATDQAYPPIVASGTNAATLHYVKNNTALWGQANLLLDAAGQYSCYAADITRTFPLGGSFTHESRQIYDIVLRMQTECTGMLKAGVLWDDVHARAHEIAIEGLLNIGILKGNKVDIFNARTSVAFFPHGLGHYLGLDTHDTGGHANYDDADSMYRYLRVRGHLPAGSVITVEPGIYFCRFIIEPYLKDPKQSQYIDEGVLFDYWQVGGVRIEDNVLVMEEGWENLTTAVKERTEVENVMNGA